MFVNVAASAKCVKLSPIDQCDFVQTNGHEEALLVQHRLPWQLFQSLKLVTPQQLGKHHLGREEEIHIQLIRKRAQCFRKNFFKIVQIFTLASILIIL